MNAKALIPLVAGLGIGGLALVLGINTLKNARAGQQPSPKVKVWAAKEDVPRGTELREEMLVALPFPAELVPQGAFRKADELIGRVPRVVAPAGLPILETMLSPAGTRPGIFVKPGYRAIAVKIDSSSGVDYHLEPGCFVDVVGSFKVRRNGRSETIARTIIENAEVAAVGARLSPTSNEEEGKKDKNQTIRAVTLYVKPELVPKLLLTEQEGKIKLSLRGYTDEQMVGEGRWTRDSELMGAADETPAAPEEQPTSGAALDWLRGLFQGPQQPAPETQPAVVAAAVPPPAPEIERWILRIYRGNKEEVIKFKGPNSNERVDELLESNVTPPPPQPHPVSPAPANLDASNDQNQGDSPEPEELFE